MATQQKAFQKSITLPAGLGDWTQIKPKKKDDKSIIIGPIKGVYFDRLPQAVVNEGLDIHYRFAQRLVLEFSRKLKIRLELHAVRCLQASYVDFLRETSHRAYQANFPVGAAAGAHVHLYVDEVLASALVNRALGGKGEAAPDTTLSGAERAIMLQLVNGLGDLLKEAWHGVLPQLSTTLPETFSALQVDSTLAKEDTYVVFTQDIVMGDESVRSLRWAYSRSLLNQLLTSYMQKKPAKPRSVQLSEKVQHQLKLPLRLVLGSTMLTAMELKKLQAGDVVALDTSLSDPVQIRISDKVTLYGQPGMVDGHIGVQLLSANALATVFREQLGAGKALQQLTIDDETLIEEARQSQQAVMDDWSVNEDDDDDDAGEPVLAKGPLLAVPEISIAVNAPIEAVAEPLSQAPMASAEESESAAAESDEVDDSELDDLFNDKDFNWDEVIDDDEEN